MLYKKLANMKWYQTNIGAFDDISVGIYIAAAG